MTGQASCHLLRPMSGSQGSSSPWGLCRAERPSEPGGRAGDGTVGPLPTGPTTLLAPWLPAVGLSRDVLERQVLHQRSEHRTLQDP